MISKKVKLYIWVIIGVVVLSGVMLMVKLTSVQKSQDVKMNEIKNTKTIVESFAPLTEKDLNKKAMNPENTYAVDNKKEVFVYSFRAEGGKFIPEEIVVEKGRRIQFQFTAVDADYDFSIARPIGAYVVAKKGKTVIFSFDASKEMVGVYNFSCRDYCPSHSDSMKGTIIVK